MSCAARRACAAVSVLLLLAILLRPAVAAPVRIKEIASLEGVRENPLFGYGLVVGLAGTGDKRQTVFSAQSLTNLLQNMGVVVSPLAIQVRNIAAVMVTASLPAYGQPGTRVDVTVAAVGDATNLQGGLLLVTPLRGVDGNTYALAQGPVVTGGFVAGGGGNRQTLNHPTTGRVPSGAIIERAPPSPPPASVLRFQLHRADFTTASRVVAAINRSFQGDGEIARAPHAGLVQVSTPARLAGKVVEFVSQLESLTIEADRRARIVINERTGTIVLGKEVQISPVAILHGALAVEIQTTFAVSQPAPLNRSGSTVVAPEVGVRAKEEPARNVVLKQGATVEELVRALQTVGSTPRDILAILQNLQAAGALEAELEVI